MVVLGDDVWGLPVSEAGEEVIPFAAEDGAEAGQDWEAWEICAGLDALEVAGADGDLLGDLLLGEAATDAEGGDVFSQALSVRGAGGAHG